MSAMQNSLHILLEQDISYSHDQTVALVYLRIVTKTTAPSSITKKY